MKYHRVSCVSIVFDFSLLATSAIHIDIHIDNHNHDHDDDVLQFH